MPLPLLFVGGALGGFIGGIATVMNGRLFRSERGPAAKYALSGLITVSAVVLFFVLAITLRSAFGTGK